MDGHSTVTAQSQQRYTTGAGGLRYTTGPGGRGGAVLQGGTDLSTVGVGAPAHHRQPGRGHLRRPEPGPRVAALVLVPAWLIGWLVGWWVGGWVVLSDW